LPAALASAAAAAAHSSSTSSALPANYQTAGPAAAWCSPAAPAWRPTCSAPKGGGGRRQLWAFWYHRRLAACAADAHRHAGGEGGGAAGAAGAQTRRGGSRCCAALPPAAHLALNLCGQVQLGRRRYCPQAWLPQGGRGLRWRACWLAWGWVPPGPMSSQCSPAALWQQRRAQQPEQAAKPLGWGRLQRRLRRARLGTAARSCWGRRPAGCPCAAGTPAPAPGLGACCSWQFSQGPAGEGGAQLQAGGWPGPCLCWTVTAHNAQERALPQRPSLALQAGRPRTCDGLQVLVA
jgi:hypothetical protein